ncbi:MAG: RNA 2',3'-cyclic phosphodiesterase [Bacillota bacterium]
MSAIRCFIAVFLDPAIRPKVAAFQRQLARAGADVKWVEAENLHFTLKFLGDVQSTRLEGIGRALEAAVAGVQAFELGLGGAGAFPNTRNPRVIWIGVSTGRDPLIDLASRVEEAMKAEGFRQDGKGLSPHLTIGRVRSARNLHALAQELSSSSPPVATMRVDRVQLTSSDLTTHGPVYAPVRVIPLL